MTEATQTTPENTPVAAEQVQQYYHLIAGNVVYKIPGAPANENPMGIITLNGVITTDDKILRVADLNQAQQVLQQHFRLKTEDPSLEVADVIILNIVRLGYQSEFEFHNLNLPA